ncbi:MAG: flagellar motor protein [Planctomycetes bacterium]|nr:flagellar motor protein [Planctomycetota bacterium]
MALAGLLIAIGGILGGHYLEEGRLRSLYSGTAFMVVIVGSFGAVLTATPRADVVRGLRAFRDVLFPPLENLAAQRDALLELAALARREGLIGLEEQLERPDLDPFLKKSLGLAVDGSSAEALRETVETDMALRIGDSQGAARFWETWGSLCPTIGVLGAVLGLIHVMRGLETMSQIGQGIAVAFVATIYGVGYSNIVCLPVAFKLKRVAQREQIKMSMILEGVLGIQAGVSPGVLKSRLSVYLPELAEGAAHA